ncbi:MAG: nucleotidyltransferase domain-containing protein, partial [Nanoarchaeota archaeon]
MITKKQLKIFEVFAKNPFAEHTRKEIKKDAKEKSNNSMFLSINALKKEGIISEKKIGKSGILTLNLNNDLVNNDLAFHYLALCNSYRIPPFVKSALEILKEEITEETPFYSVVIFGSYAVGKQKKELDLDIAIFIQNEDNRKRIEALANSAKLKSTAEMDIHVISKAEMFAMLTNAEENFGKQIAR